MFQHKVIMFNFDVVLQDGVSVLLSGFHCPFRMALLISTCSIIRRLCPLCLLCAFKNVKVNKMIVKVILFTLK